MSTLPQQLTFGVIIGNRGFFPSYLVGEARQQAVALFEKMNINTVMLDETQTNLGGVETRQEAKTCAALFRQHREAIHGIVVLLPNFGDEKAIAEALRLAGLNVPVLVQAEEDNLDKMGLATRRDSFCGKISLCNNLRQYPVYADPPARLRTERRRVYAGSAAVQPTLSGGECHAPGTRRGDWCPARRIQHRALQRKAAGEDGHRGGDPGFIGDLYPHQPAAR